MHQSLPSSRRSVRLAAAAALLALTACGADEPATTAGASAQQPSAPAATAASAGVSGPLTVFAAAMVLLAGWSVRVAVGRVGAPANTGIVIRKTT